MTTLPALSTPCIWNTFLARSTPMVLTCIWTTPSGDSLFNDPFLAHSMPGAGVVHHIKGGGRGRSAKVGLPPDSGGMADIPQPPLGANIGHTHSRPLISSRFWPAVRSTAKSFL